MVEYKGVKIPPPRATGPAWIAGNWLACDTIGRVLHYACDCRGIDCRTCLFEHGRQNEELVIQALDEGVIKLIDYIAEIEE